MGRVMKWVGIVTAILSLIAGVREVSSLIADSEEHARNIDELHAVGTSQQTAGDYAQAWSTFEQALTSSEEDNLLAKLRGRPGQRRAALRQAQEDLAMAWLDNMHLSGEDQTFSSIVDKLIPVLLRDLPQATATRRGDLLAHIGWGYFLKTRDGNSQFDPPKWYQQSLEADPANPYGHAYWGHWKTWNRQSFDDAMKDFAAALATGRATATVRTLQLSALTNLRDNPQGEAELVRVLNDMNARNEAVGDRIRSELRSNYESAVHDEERFNKLIAAVPAKEQLATMTRFFGEPDEKMTAPLLITYATLQESSGFSQPALQTWRSARERLKLSGTRSESITKRVDAAIKRLSRCASAHWACSAKQAWPSEFRIASLSAFDRAERSIAVLRSG